MGLKDNEEAAASELPSELGPLSLAGGRFFFQGRFRKLKIVPYHLRGLIPISGLGLYVLIFPVGGILRRTPDGVALLESNKTGH